MSTQTNHNSYDNYVNNCKKSSTSLIILEKIKENKSKVCPINDLPEEKEEIPTFWSQIASVFKCTNK